ncbi:hypothetical protein BD410DRAFT_794424 [Rickenella mellea]|uniref:Secreted protein n=1 Tax=Rickenella mellea TaxID=50990 RepID=A0A4Y7PPK4_9AGAM|nr:hypothetical protein BD410DRAFT_794424 [Rickenella mellea]
MLCRFPLVSFSIQLLLVFLTVCTVGPRSSPMNMHGIPMHDRKTVHEQWSRLVEDVESQPRLWRSA